MDKNRLGISLLLCGLLIIVAVVVWGGDATYPELDKDFKGIAVEFRSDGTYRTLEGEIIFDSGTTVEWLPQEFMGDDIRIVRSGGTVYVTGPTIYQLGLHPNTGRGSHIEHLT